MPAKERIYSFRDQYGQWDPKNQRPELWNLFNGRHHKGEHIRVFPLSNWTELDVWQYIADEQIEVPSIYFAHHRTVFVRDGMLMSVNQHLTLMVERRSSRPGSGSARWEMPTAPAASNRRPPRLRTSSKKWPSRG